MTATLNAGCFCGKRLSVPCPSLADLPAAMAAIEAASWRWFPDIGHACSAPCALVSASELALLQQRASAWPPEAADRRARPAVDMPLFVEVRA